MEYRAIYNDEYISHYGVLGMRWGHRKDGGPQGYLGTYSKGGKNWTTKRTTELPKNYDKKKIVLKNNTKVIDNFLTKTSFGNGSMSRYIDFKNKGGYSVYKSVGINEKMVNVNLTKRGFQATSIGNCGSCSLAAVINKKGGNVMASPNIDGMSLFDSANIIASMGGKTAFLDDTWREHFNPKSHKPLNAMDWVNYQMPNNSIGILSYYSVSTGHAFYVQKDKDGNIVMFNPQNPTVPTGDWTNLGIWRGDIKDTNMAMSLSYLDADGEISKDIIDDLIKKGYVIPYNKDLLPAEAKSEEISATERLSSALSTSLNLINVAKNIPGPVAIGATLVTSIMKDKVDKLEVLNTVAKEAVERLKK